MGIDSSQQLHSLIAQARSLDGAMMAILYAVGGAVRGEGALVQTSVKVYRTYTTDGQRLYEALIQTYLFAGFPAAIEALNVARCTADDLDLLLSPDITEDYNIELFTKRGEQLCQLVYGNKYRQLRSRLQLLSPELDQWTIIEGYGKVLSRPTTLTVHERELCAIVALAVGGWLVQLHSHVRALRLMDAPYTALQDTTGVCIALTNHGNISELLTTIEQAWHGKS